MEIKMNTRFNIGDTVWGRPYEGAKREKYRIVAIHCEFDAIQRNKGGEIQISPGSPKYTLETSYGRWTWDWNENSLEEESKYED